MKCRSSRQYTAISYRTTVGTAGCCNAKHGRGFELIPWCWYLHLDNVFSIRSYYVHSALGLINCEVVLLLRNNILILFGRCYWSLNRVFVHQLYVSNLSNIYHLSLVNSYQRFEGGRHLFTSRHREISRNKEIFSNTTVRTSNFKTVILRSIFVWNITQSRLVVSYRPSSKVKQYKQKAGIT
jgi:hypothetical protein